MRGDDEAAQRHQKVGDLYLAALDRPSEQWRRFLEEACEGDPKLVKEVETLLLSSGERDRFMNQPAIENLKIHPRVIGPYRLLQRIGEGGMGEVWLAEQTHPIRRRAALKIIKAGMATKQVVARFESERQALALMNHAAVAKVFDAGSTDEGHPYFLMEYVPGVAITAHCDTHRLSTRDRLQLFIEVCEGVQHAHDRGIIHRDLKPSNILVAIEEDKTCPKIIDFGIAKATSQPLTDLTLFTELGTLMGTPEYMSPEQAGVTAQDIDGRTDVYSLGVILYELLVGGLPFEGTELRKEGYEGVRRMLRETEPPAPSSKLLTGGAAKEEAARKRGVDGAKLVAQVRGDLDWIVMKAIEKDRTRRYASPAELAADIRRHLANEPVRARRPSFSYRAGRFVKRHQTRLATGLLVAVSAAALVSAALLFRRGGNVEPLQHSAAVFAFDDLSSAKNQGPLSEGLAEEIRDALSSAGWRVAPRTSSLVSKTQSMDPVRIGRELKVAAVVAGSISDKAGGTKIAVRILKTPDGSALWNGSFDTELNGTFAAQERITSTVVRSLGAAPVERKSTRPANAEAYAAYLEGRLLLERANPANLQKATALFKKATMLSPRYAKAWMGLAQVYSSQADWALGDIETNYKESRAAANRAMELDPDLPGIYSVLGRVKFFHDWDSSGADDWFRRGLKIDPNNGDVLFTAAMLARAQGRLYDALDLHRRDVEVDPKNATAIHDYGMTLHYMGRNAEAETELKKSLELAPEGANNHAMLSRVYLAQSRPADALAEAKLETHPLFKLCALALAYQGAGDRKQSDANLAGLIKEGSKVAPYNIAGVYAVRGDTAAAFKWLDRAYVERDTALFSEIKTDPLLEGLRADQRYEALVRKLGLPR